MRLRGTVGMSKNGKSVTTVEPVQTVLPTPQTLGLDRLEENDVKRLLAKLLRSRAEAETYITSLKVKQSYAEYAAFMLWDLIVHGKAMFSDGSTFEINDYDEWLKTVRFVFSHLDGPARDGAQFTGINIFKVYAGFDPDQV